MISPILAIMLDEHGYSKSLRNWDNLLGWRAYDIQVTHEVA